MLIAILGLIIGIVLGFIVPFELSTISALYLSVGLLAGIDSIIGALKASMENKFDTLIFISGFLVNAVVAILLSFIGDRMGVPLYYAAIFVFGTRLFDNIGVIRRIFIQRLREKTNRSEIVDTRVVTSLRAKVDVTKE